MPYTVTLPRLGEADAQRIADAIGETALGDAALDAAEAADGSWELTLYLESPPRPEDLLLLQRTSGAVLGAAPTWQTHDLPETNWVAKSLAGLGPVRVGRFLVHGSHSRDRLTPNLIGLEIEAGEAFGTGHHGSTAGCLEAIARIARTHLVGNALDLGTGTGVLAIAIARTWRTPVLATDIDPIAIEVARQNAALNGTLRHLDFAVAAGLSHPVIAGRGPYGLIVANILARPLAQLAPALARELAPGGFAVLSGILPEQASQVVAAYRSGGLRLLRQSERDGWSTLVLESPAPA
ncbi:MAG: 50S ribosomal protein L11 methyltransferase [Bauldia sp.]|nr:50S ribosomal protein L11 methyltransferase [Bauldia sp.]